MRTVGDAGGRSGVFRTCYAGRQMVSRSRSGAELSPNSPSSCGPKSDATPGWQRQITAHGCLASGQCYDEAAAWPRQRPDAVGRRGQRMTIAALTAFQ